MKIFLLGIYPPPYGGISVHVKRLYEKLSNRNFNVILYSNSKCDKRIKHIYFLSLRKILVKCLLIRKKDIVHCHIPGIWIKMFLGFYCLILRKKVILSIHGDGIIEQYQQLNIILKKLFLKSIQSFTKIIAVNDKIKEDCMKLGIQPERIQVIPSYSNPIKIKEDYLNIDKRLWQYIEYAKQNKYVIITANGNIRFYNNQDLYGLDLLIDLTIDLIHRNYKVVLVFVLLEYENQTKEERKYFNKLLSKISNYHIEKNIFIYKARNTEYYPILEKSSIFIRPTNTDGDAISLRESLYLKVPSLASDIVKRPEGVVLFRNRDLNDLIEKVICVLDNYDNYLEKLESIYVREYFKDIIEVYKEVSGDKDEY